MDVMKKDRYSSSSRRRESPEDDGRTTRRGRDYRRRHSPPTRSRRSRSRSRSRSRDYREYRNDRDDGDRRNNRDYRRREEEETRRREREPSPEPKKKAAVSFVPEKDVQLDADLSPEEIQMMIAMGIPFGFDTTQGRHVEDEGANQGAVKTATKRRARQYMNRKRGFNRPLPSEKTGERITGD